MKIKLAFITLLVCGLSMAQKGTVKGTLTDKDANNAPLAFANAIIKGTQIGVTTDEKGQYSLSVEAGNHIVQFSYVGYENVEVTVKVAAGETVEVNKALGSGSYKLEDVVVQKAASREKETALLLDQKKAVEIKQSIGAQEMSRKGISDVEEGLTKITGISKVDGRGLFVRGLEDRYNNLLINDLAVPSNNPFKKIIPLDLFPTDIVSILETYKTFNTPIYGDFAGGTFNIITARNGKSLTKVNIGFGYTTNNNLNKFLISEDANSTGDFFGFSGNERDIPKAVGSTPSAMTFNSTQSQSFGSGFDVEETKSPLNTSFGLTHTEKFTFGKNQDSFQYFLSLNYDNKYQARQGVDRFFNVAQGNYDNDLYNTQYKFITNTSALVALTYKNSRLSLTSNTIYLKTTENMVQDQVGYTNSATVNTNGFIRMNQLLETNFLNTQLLANYKLTQNDRHNLKVGASYTMTSFELPDRKSFKGVRLDDNTTSISYTGNSLFRQYFDVDGKFYASGLLEYNWRFGKEDNTKAHKLTVGYNGYMNKMESTFRFLISQDMATNGVSFNTNAPDATLLSEIQAGNFTYREGTNSTYRAKLQEFVNAGYFDLAFKFGEKYELNLGARMEQTSRETKYRNPGSFDDPFVTKKLDKVDFLPTLNMKYKLNDQSNLRFAASKTITHPVIMEAYPLEFVNLDGTIENGNPNAKNSDNYNFDLKYEVFPTAKEMVAVTAFSKYIQNPIERLFVQSAGSGGQVITYDNSKSAMLIGAELEFLVQLDRLTDALKSFSLGFNTSLMYTKVKVNNTIETNPDRQLQGASPWLVNTDLKYEFDFSSKWKNTMSLIYNVYGKRIFAVGTNGLDHYYEQPFHKLDFVWTNNIAKNWDVKFAVDNILNPKYSVKLGDENKVPINESDLTVRDFKKGVGFSINLGYTF